MGIWSGHGDLGIKLGGLWHGDFRHGDLGTWDSKAHLHNIGDLELDGDFEMQY